MRKKSETNFGSTPVKYISPATTQTFNIGISFQDAMQLHLSLGQCLQKLNTRHMAFKEGKNATVKLVLFGEHNRIMVTED